MVQARRVSCVLRRVRTPVSQGISRRSWSQARWTLEKRQIPFFGANVACSFIALVVPWGFIGRSQGPGQKSVKSFFGKRLARFQNRLRCIDCLTIMPILTRPKHSYDRRLLFATHNRAYSSISNKKQVADDGDLNFKLPPAISNCARQGSASATTPPHLLHSIAHRP